MAVGGQCREEKRRWERGERRGNWAEEDIMEFIKNFGKRKEGEKGVEEEWRELRERIKGAVLKMEKGEKKKKGGWRDEECKEKKSKVRKELKNGEGRIWERV